MLKSFYRWWHESFIIATLLIATEIDEVYDTVIHTSKKDLAMAILTCLIIGVGLGFVGLVFGYRMFEMLFQASNVLDGIVGVVGVLFALTLVGIAFWIMRSSFFSLCQPRIDHRPANR